MPFSRAFDPSRIAKRLPSTPGAVPREPRQFRTLRTSRRLRDAPERTVKFCNAQKGFGFIKPDDGGKDVFVHVTAVEQSGIPGLDEGMRISFETEPDKRGKGPKAVNLASA